MILVCPYNYTSLFSNFIVKYNSPFCSSVCLFSSIVGLYPYDIVSVDKQYGKRLKVLSISVLKLSLQLQLGLCSQTITIFPSYKVFTFTIAL